MRLIDYKLLHKNSIDKYIVKLLIQFTFSRARQKNTGTIY
jgi:hypothetical protein